MESFSSLLDNLPEIIISLVENSKKIKNRTYIAPLCEDKNGNYYISIDNSLFSKLLYYGLYLLFIGLILERFYTLGEITGYNFFSFIIPILFYIPFGILLLFL